MCIGKAKTPSTPKIDPAPTTVQASDVDTGGQETKKKDRRGRGSTVLEDRGSILGNLGGSTGTNGGRNYLG
jgi:hypothetical protein